MMMMMMMMMMMRLTRGRNHLLAATLVSSWWNMASSSSRMMPASTRCSRDGNRFFSLKLTVRSAMQYDRVTYLLVTGYSVM